MGMCRIFEMWLSWCRWWLRLYTSVGFVPHVQMYKGHCREMPSESRRISPYAGDCMSITWFCGQTNYLLWTLFDTFDGSIGPSETRNEMARPQFGGYIPGSLKDAEPQCSWRASFYMKLFKEHHSQVLSEKSYFRRSWVFCFGASGNMNISTTFLWNCSHLNI